MSAMLRAPPFYVCQCWPVVAATPMDHRSRFEPNGRVLCAIVTLGALAIAGFAVMFFKSDDETIKTIGAVGALISLVFSCMGSVCYGIMTGPVPVPGVDFEDTDGTCTCDACRAACYECCTCQP